MLAAELSLELSVCPWCGMHADVLVKHKGTVVRKIRVISKEDARELNARLVAGGGQDQLSFLAQVESSTLVESFPQTGLLFMLFGTALADAPTEEPSPTREPADYSAGKLILRQCDGCHQDGRIYLELPGRPPRYLKQVWSKVEACEELERWVLQGLPEQAEFEEQVRAADWLAGSMPVKL